MIRSWPLAALAVTAFCYIIASQAHIPVVAALLAANVVVFTIVGLTRSRT